MFNPDDYLINKKRYRLTYKSINFLLKISPLNLHTHDLDDKDESGTIFLFNHFTRFETFIPQYILYDKKKVFCRAIAAHNLFGDHILGDYLKSVGAIPNNIKQIMEYLVDETNLGRKLIIFPEGGMIKDRKVRDEEGRLAVYKWEKSSRRKPHTGAAVIAIKCQILRDLYLMARRRNDDRMINYYREKFPIFNSLDEIDKFAGKSVEIIPANMTFYPMRRDENILESYVKRFHEDTSKRVMEELKIEGNILLKQTDMDVRFGEPVKVKEYLDTGYQMILNSHYYLDRLTIGGDETDYKKMHARITRRLDTVSSVWIKQKAERMRDVYMCAIYDLTSINLGHLTAHALFDLYDKSPEGEVKLRELRSLLYAAVGDMRTLRDVYLHKDLLTRRYVESLLLDEEPHLLKILQQFEKADLISIVDNQYITFKSKLVEEFPFDKIRIENPALVLDNEAQSVPKAVASLNRLYSEKKHVLEEKIAFTLHRRALRIFESEEKTFSGPEYEKVNEMEERSATGAPFFYRTSKAQADRTGVLLIHGFSASPAEMKIIGKKLHGKGYDVLGVRLPGHGTSPADLKDRNREEWLREVKLGLSALFHLCSEVFVIGNSMGAILGLMAISNNSIDVAGFVAIAPAFRIQDRRLPLAGYVDATQRIYQLFAELKSDWPYSLSRPENPSINYSRIPYHALLELYQLTKESNQFVDKLEVPTLFIQSEGDHTVDPEATYNCFEKVPAKKKNLLKLDDQRHVLTLDESLPVFNAILAFLENVSGGEPV